MKIFKIIVIDYLKDNETIPVKIFEFTLQKNMLSFTDCIRLYLGLALYWIKRLPLRDKWP